MTGALSKLLKQMGGCHQVQNSCRKSPSRLEEGAKIIALNGGDRDPAIEIQSKFPDACRVVSPPPDVDGLALR